MEVKEFVCSDETTIRYRYWPVEHSNVQAVVHIFHGMAEHSGRYDQFATYLNSLGFAVYAQDHRGHGLSADETSLGFFAPRKGWKRVMEDGYELSLFIAQEHPQCNLFLFGHSMGSFLVRSLIPLRHGLYTAAILSGTGGSQKAIGAAGKLLAGIRSFFLGKRHKDGLLDKLSFGSFNAPFAPNRTPFDWLSRDEALVDAYIADPLCGFICSSQFFVDLLNGIKMANNKRLAKKIPNKLALLLISGANDPVGKFGKGVQEVLRLYQKAGLEDVSMNLLKGARHEVLNETNREEVFVSIGQWLVAHNKKNKTRQTVK
ncbi:MAG: lysophospholipase [Sphaerochaetaceae bacterium]|jgi:alpha-beta hydrolase superfamily lysophospholipase